MSAMSNFTKNVRTIRLSKRITQAHLAELAGLHVTYINAVENGRRNISLENVDRIAAALGVEPYVLLKPLDGEESDGSFCC